MYLKGGKGKEMKQKDMEKHKREEDETGVGAMCEERVGRCGTLKGQSEKLAHMHTARQELTTMCKRTRGTKTRTVNAVDTAIEGLFSGTLNKCWRGEVCMLVSGNSVLAARESYRYQWLGLVHQVLLCWRCTARELELH